MFGNEGSARDTHGSYISSSPKFKCSLVYLPFSFDLCITVSNKKGVSGRVAGT
jgi:hypothetical protein